MPELKLQVTEELIGELEKAAKLNLVTVEDVAVNILAQNVKKGQYSILKTLKRYLPAIIAALEDFEEDNKHEP